MLFLTTVTKWVGVGRESHIINKILGTQYVFDINNVTNLQVEGTGSKFQYVTSTANRKAGYDEIHCTSSVQTIRNEYDVGPGLKTMALSIFPNNDITKTPSTKYISTYDFSYAWAHNPYPQYSWLIYSQKGIGDRRVLVNMTLAQIVALDYVFNEFNVQWYTFVDPLEQIHPEWYIWWEH